jgi:hypothetical protein
LSIFVDKFWRLYRLSGFTNWALQRTH